MARQLQFGAVFKPNIRYLRHIASGVVYPFNPILENDPAFKVVVFKEPIRVVSKPIGYIPDPPEEETPVVEEDKTPTIISTDTVNSDILGASIDDRSVAKPLSDGTN